MKTNLFHFYYDTWREKIKKDYVKKIKLKGLTPLLFASPKTKDVKRRPCLRNTHTYTLFSSSFHGRLSPQISFCDPHPTVGKSLFLSFFEYKPASRRKPLRTHTQEPSRGDIQLYHVFKNIYTDITLELPKDDQVLLLQGLNDVL